MNTSSNNNSTEGREKPSSFQHFKNMAFNSPTAQHRDVANAFLDLGSSPQRATVVSSTESSLSSHSTAIATTVAAAAEEEGTNNKQQNYRLAPATATKKRHRDDESSRAEIKCQTEKRRRRDMNKGFDDLMSTLVKIDPKIKAVAELQDITGLSSSSSAPNRVEVISGTAVVLDRIHKENEDRKVQIVELNTKLEAATNERNQALALLASNNRASASPGLQGYQQGTATLLQSLIQAANPPPAVPCAQLLLALAQNVNVQLTAPAAAVTAPAAAGNAVGLTNLLIQNALTGLSSRHYSL